MAWIFCNAINVSKLCFQTHKNSLFAFYIFAQEHARDKTNKNERQFFKTLPLVLCGIKHKYPKFKMYK